MAEGHECEVVPTRQSGQFHFRVCFSPAEAFKTVVATSVIAGCGCHVIFLRCDSADEFRLTLLVRHGSNPTREGIKLIPNMVLLDKAGSPASMGTWGLFPHAVLQDVLVYNLDLHAVLQDVRKNCVVDDYFQVMCSVEVIRDGAPAPPKSTEEEELPDLGNDLAMMSEKQELTDVSFDVEGESFSAHRLVLAARSSVFRALLYGSMAESKMTSITIQEMGASTFRSMLYYMYHGSLPNASKTNISSTMAEYQRLLAAADRYGLERLKKICEDKLCGNGITVNNVVSLLELAERHICPKLKAICEDKLCGNGITVNNVVSLLELAERHICPKLKASCLDFLSDGENFKMVATTEEYFNLMQTVPSVLVEVRNRFKVAHEKPTITEPDAPNSPIGAWYPFAMPL